MVEPGYCVKCGIKTDDEDEICQECWEEIVDAFGGSLE